jgi:hypothetical protein
MHTCTHAHASLSFVSLLMCAAPPQITLMAHEVVYIPFAFLDLTPSRGDEGHVVDGNDKKVTRLSSPLCYVCHAGADDHARR